MYYEWYDIRCHYTEVWKLTLETISVIPGLQNSGETGRIKYTNNQRRLNIILT
jgi:hypothetical protein